jgi:hypothetical protein
MDPPWYLDHMYSWLETALLISSTETKLITTIFPDLVRPSARREQRELVNTLSEVGRVIQCDEQVLYESPLYEQETLSALGLPKMQCWRAGLVMHVEVENPDRNLDAPNPSEGEWRRVLVNDQIVAIRDQSNRGEISVSSPYPDGSHVLRSVSRRDSVRNQINLWTSTNRVAIISGTDRVVSFLRIASTLSDAAEAIGQVAESHSEEKALYNILRIIHSGNANE